MPEGQPIIALSRYRPAQWLALSVACFALAGGVGHAQSPAVTPTTGVVSIESDVQRADNLTGVVTASGNVRIIYADRRVVATARQAQPRGTGCAQRRRGCDPGRWTVTAG
jgi:lipopolysaccharide assembly outer membrane protein LptD (OstA)